MKGQPLTITEHHPICENSPAQTICQAVTTWLKKELQK